MNAQHTPGPWRFTEGEYLYVNGTGDDGKRTFILQRTIKGNRLSEQERIRADARLIAAAPDLLEALKEIFRELAWDQLPPHKRSLAENARAAITKATGGQA